MNTVIPEPEKPANPYIQRIKIVKGDITEQDTDAVVALLPKNLDYTGAVNTALKEKAGVPLDEILRENIYRPRPGDIYALPGYDLRCKHILFCVVPYWRHDIDRHDRLLLNAARKAMETAREMSLSSIAFPPLGTGQNGYPKPRGARLLLRGCADRLGPDINEIRIISRSDKTLEIFRARLKKMGWKEK